MHRWRRVAIPLGRQLELVRARASYGKNRSIYLAPAAVAAFTLLGFLISVDTSAEPGAREAIAL
jgi:hypothetical protein